MDVHLQIHLEALPERSPTWWAESPEVPGLSVLDDQLANLLIRADQAVREILIEQGADVSQLTVQYELVDNQPDLTREESPKIELEGPRLEAPPRPNPRVAMTRILTPAA